MTFQSTHAWESAMSLVMEVARDVAAPERKRLAEQHQAMPDGSYPIATVADLRNAIRAIGRAKNPAAVRQHIKRAARRLGREDLIPIDW